MNVSGSEAPPSSAGWRRLLFVQSGSVESAALAIVALRPRLAEDPALTYLTHDPGIVPPRELLPECTEVLVAPRSWRSYWSLYRRIAGRPYDRIVFLLTREPGYRRFKLLALGLWSRPLVVFDEGGSCWGFGAAGLYRLLRRRLGGGRGRARTDRRPAERVPAVPEAPAGVTAAPRSGAPDAPDAATELGEPPANALPALTLPRCERPAISVILPVDRTAHTGVDCLRSLVETSPGVAYEVVVVTAGTASESTGTFPRIENARGASVPVGAGTAAAWNAGAAEARGDRLLLLAAGVTVTPGCLETLSRTLDLHEECGAVGPRVVGSEGRLVEAGGIIWRDGTLCPAGAGEDPEAPAFSYLREADTCSSSAILVRRSLFERLGGCDPQLTGAECAADLCLGARTLGSTALVQPAATVVRTALADAPAPASERFRSKWRGALGRQLEPDRARSFLARDRQRRKAILVIDHYVPTHDKDAGSFVMLRILMTLKRLGYRVVFWPDNLYRLPGYTDELQQAGIEVVYGVASFEDLLAERSRFLDGILIHRSVMAAKYLEKIRRDGPPVFYVCADLEHLREERRAAVDGGSCSRARALYERELEILGRVARAAIHSPVEREHLAAALPGKPICVLPLPVRPGAAGGPDFGERQGLLFVGSTHPPNVDAVQHYAGRLAPLIARRLPGVALTVVGEASRAFTELGGEPLNGRIRLAGFVPAIEEYYRSSRVFVAPLRYGAGVKGKILEAMSHGLPVVTTSIGAEGIPIVPGVDALVADDEEGFADAVARLYGCRETWAAVRARGRALIDEHYSDRAFETALKELIEG